MNKKRRRRSYKKILIFMSLLLVTLTCVTVFFHKSTSKKSAEKDKEINTNQSENSTNQSETNTNQSFVEFPCLLDEGKLEIESLFQFDGINPDNENKEGKDIASIMIRNISEDYLIRADIAIVLQDGEVVKFVVTELPAGKSTMAFSVDNLTVMEEIICKSISCEAVYEDLKSGEEIPVSASTEESIITLTNTTKEDISQLTIYYREPFDDAYFGGMAKEYIVNNISADESVSVEAEESILGIIEIVRVSIN